MHNIERAIIASLLNYETVADVDSKYFTDKFHIKLINGYNRLKELNESLDFEILRAKFTQANKWTLQEDNHLLFIMSNTTPFGTQSMFNNYYNLLKQNYSLSGDKRYAI